MVPEEYIQTMRDSMLKRCPVSSYDQVCRVFVRELGQPPENVFLLFLSLVSTLCFNLYPILSSLPHTVTLHILLSSLGLC